MNYARNVHFQIKNGKEKEFTTLFENEILPMLRKQKGFKEELTLVNKDKAVGISLWADRASAEAYQTSTYPKIVQKLNPVIVGTPRVETYEVFAGATTLRVAA
ncbi:MAG: antibiotic biosynthesis monooxygenase [Thermoanaerobaculia bacterium]